MLTQDQGTGQMPHPVGCDQGRQEDWGDRGQMQKLGPQKMDCVRGMWWHVSKKFQDFTCSEVCSGDLFSCMHTVHYSIYLQVAVFD